MASSEVGLLLKKQLVIAVFRGFKSSGFRLISRRFVGRWEDSFLFLGHAAFQCTSLCNVSAFVIAILYVNTVVLEIKMQFTLLLLSVTNLQLDGDWVRTVITE